jgi:hypothetical protein
MWDEVRLVVEYYYEIGQHGEFPVPSIEKGIKKAKEMKLENENESNKLHYVGVCDESKVVIIYCSEWYWKYMLGLMEYMEKTDYMEFYVKTLEKVADTGEMREIPHDKS